VKASDNHCGFEENVSPSEHVDNVTSTLEATPGISTSEVYLAISFDYE